MICYKCDTNKPNTEFFQGMQSCKACAMNDHISKVGNIRHEWRPPIEKRFGAQINSAVAVKKAKKPTVRWCDGCKKEHPILEFHYTGELCRACRAIKKREKIEAKKDSVNARRRERYALKPKREKRIDWENLSDRECSICKTVKLIKEFRYGNHRCRECVRVLDRQDRANNLEYYRLRDILKDYKRGQKKLDEKSLADVIQKLNVIKEQKKPYPANKATDS